MEKIINALARELNIKAKQAEATVQLLDEGNTVPFIARYRKEATGSLDEEQIRTIEERLAYLRNLEQRRQEILTAIASQEKLTPELEKAINAAEKMQALEQSGSAGSSYSSYFSKMFSSHPETSERIKHIKQLCERDGYTRP